MARLTLHCGDITNAHVEVLVNAWNRNFIPYWLLIPQGVAGALRRHAGSGPFKEVRRAGLLPLGGVAETGAGRLENVDRIFHVAALHAYWSSSQKAVELSAAEVFRKAEVSDAKSLAIPLLGAGTGGVDPAVSFRIIRDAWRCCERRPDRTEVYIFEFDVYHDILTRQGWREGFDHLASGAFWDAHEAWEEIWNLLPDSPARESVQALIQVAAACHKIDQAATRKSANMQRGMGALIETANEHLSRSRGPGSPGPGFELAAPQDTLNHLAKLLGTWRAGTPHDAIRGSARKLMREFAAEFSDAELLRLDKQDRN